MGGFLEAMLTVVEVLFEGKVRLVEVLEGARLTGTEGGGLSRTHLLGGSSEDQRPGLLS